MLYIHIYFITGDKVVLTSTDYNYEQAETATVVKCLQCSTKQVKIDRKYSLFDDIFQDWSKFGCKFWSLHVLFYFIILKIYGCSQFWSTRLIRNFIHKTTNWCPRKLKIGIKTIVISES